MPAQQNQPSLFPEEEVSKLNRTPDNDFLARIITHAKTDMERRIKQQRKEQQYEITRLQDLQTTAFAHPAQFEAELPYPDTGKPLTNADTYDDVEDAEPFE